MTLNNFSGGLTYKSLVGAGTCTAIPWERQGVVQHYGNILGTRSSPFLPRISWGDPYHSYPHGRYEATSDNHFARIKTGNWRGTATLTLSKNLKENLPVNTFFILLFYPHAGILGEKQNLLNPGTLHLPLFHTRFMFFIQCPCSSKET